ncbi:MAG: TGc protein [Dehalococcoidia bacterium]|nr:TGc protein [Dehalococcoidia bacterium]
MSMVRRVQDLLKGLGLTFWLQVAAMTTAARSVEAARWVPTPPLTLVVFLATLMAAFVVHQREQRRIHHLWAVLGGAALVYLGGVYLAEGDPWFHAFSDLHSRVALWWAAVAGEDVTTDTLPLSMALIAITWLTAYLTSWALFKHHALWAALLPVGAGITVNLTYLPERFSFYFFVYLLIALPLIAHITGLRRRSRLQAQGRAYPPSLPWLSLAHGLWLSVITLGIAMVIPLGDSPITPLKGAFRPMNRSVDDLRNELHRIFAAVPGHNIASIRFFGSVLPLLRTVPTGEETVFFAESPFPLYWSAIAYDQYTSKAWRVEDTEMRPLLSALDGEDEGLTPGPGAVAYKIRLRVGSPYLMIAGNPILVEPSAQQEAPAPKTFQIDLTNSGQDKKLPPDLQRWVSTIPGETGHLELELIPLGLMVTKVTKELPASGVSSTISIEYQSASYYANLRRALESEGDTVGMEVRLMPAGMSQVAYKPLKPLRAGREYSVTAELNMSSEATLRESPQSYPPEISDRYLHIPDTVPSRVVELALDLSREASNPYDKAVAIEAYLREMQYSTARRSLPHDADAVDYFLFESGEGYSDYFASAMAVMLRGAGVPTRLVLGFGPGVEDPETQGYVVRDKDSHSWPEVYFPNIGWVAFEPTPIYELRLRGPEGNPFGLAASVDGGPAEEEPGPEPGPLEPKEERNDFGGPLPGGFGPLALPLRHFGSPLGTGGALFALFLLLGALLLRALWSLQYGALRYPEAAYERMRSLASFLGIPSPLSQTPFEFAYHLSQAVPQARDDIDLVCNAFVRQRYGGKELTAVEGVRISRAWSRVKRELLAQPQGAREPSHPPA